MRRLGSLRLIPPLETYPRLCDAARTTGGKLLLLAVFALLLRLHDDSYWLDIVVVLVATSFYPRHRGALVTVGTLGVLARHGWPNTTLLTALAQREGVLPDGRTFVPIVVAAAVVASGLIVHLARGARRTAVTRRPLLTLVGGYLVLLAIASYAPPFGVAWVCLWGFLIVFGKYLWFVAYSLLDRDPKGETTLAVRVGHWLPFWGGAFWHVSSVPFPKGDAYLRRIESRNELDLAVVQLKAIKLLTWATVLGAGLAVFDALAYGSPGPGGRPVSLPFTLDVPRLEDAFRAYVSGQPYPVHVCWLSVLCNFVRRLWSLSVRGHTIIATCRMAGFRAPRNTYRPLQSTTIAEFWNRYYFYYKELLAEVFFYPTFLRYFKGWPRLRVFAATMAAAGLGNAMYHFTRDIEPIIENGFVAALVSFHVYLFYCLVLGTAIGISQMRARAGLANRSFGSRVRASLGVVGFYCLLGVFDDPIRSRTILDYAGFFLGLFGIS